MYDAWSHTVPGPTGPRPGTDLAGVLHQLAADWASAFARRRRAADTALASWTGPAADEFADRLAAATVRSELLCAELRALAGRWALVPAEGVEAGHGGVGDGGGR